MEGGRRAGSTSDGDEKEDVRLGAITSMSNLTSTYRNQGRWKEAEELQAKELDICKRILGAEHPDTLSDAGHVREQRSSADE
jgi:hypothetical protein